MSAGAVEIVRRAAQVLPELLEEMLGMPLGGSEGYCVQVSEGLVAVLDRCGVQAETVAVDVRCLSDASAGLLARGVPQAFWPENALRITASRPQGAFSGHAVVRVPLPAADLDLLADLTLGQYRKPEWGINPPDAHVCGWAAGEMDRGMVSVARPGQGRIDYTLRPDMSDWAGAGMRVRRFVGGGDGPVLSEAESWRFMVGVAAERVGAVARAG
jgi:hypothetical protein